MDSQGQLHIQTKDKAEKSDQITETDGLSNLPDHVIHRILSHMSTKDAVRTSVLSKSWRYHWTNINSLDFNRRSFKNWSSFFNFLIHVLHNRKDSNLHKLKFYCWGKVDDSFDEGEAYTMKRIMFEYARCRHVEEIESDDIINSFSSKPLRFPTLKTLKLNQPIECLTNLSGFTSLTTLQLTSLYFYSNNDVFSPCLNLENLSLVDCEDGGLMRDVFIISTPRLVHLQILECEFHGRIVINAPALKFFDFDGIDPLKFAMDKCVALEYVNYHMIMPTYIFNAYFEELDQSSMMQLSVDRMIHIGQHLNRIKSFTLTLNLLKEKLIIYHKAAANTEVARLDKETRKEHLLFDLPIDGEFDIYDQLGITLDEMLSKLSLESGRTLLTGLALMGDLAQRLSHGLPILKCL